MKNVNKTPNSADQSRIGDASRQKREVNLRKNSTIYFQVGLILCLLVTYSLLEMNFESPQYAMEKITVIEDDEPTIAQWRPEKKVIVEEKKKQPEQKVFTGQDPKVVDDETPEELVTKLLNPDELDPITPVDPSTIEDPTDGMDEIEEPFSIIGVEKVPVYPGCEKAKNNDERRKCMSQQISKLIQKKFNTNIAEKYGLSGRQKIDVQFMINKSGLITDIKTRAPITQLENEAERVMTKIPQMDPGKQRGKPVSVIYTLPIIFEVQN